MFAFRKILLSAAISLALTAPGLAEEKPAPPPASPTTENSLDGVLLRGEILETMNSNGYTYLQLDTNRGKVWVAVPETPVKTGQTVAATPGMTMYSFTSKTLNRTFDSIIFSPGLEKTAPPAPGQPTTDAKSGKEGSGFDAALRAEAGGARPALGGGDGAAMGPSTGSVGAVVPSAEVNVHKAVGPNSFSVGECFEQGKDLNGKTVRVRGKVMKISRMIMGKNWLHIQDGTGNPLHNQHDLVVTTTEEPGEGKVITVEGVLAADRDFGAGYKYEVIVEDAKLIEQ